MNRRPSPRRKPERANDRDYYGPSSSNSPRKRQRQSVKPVFVVDIRVPFEEIADFMNRVLRVEGFTRSEEDDKRSYRDPDGDYAHVGDAIVGYSKRGGIWRVEAATDALADKLCYLNRMPYDYTIIRVKPDQGIPNNECKYSCWNEYYFKRYGENDNILDKEIIVHLAESNMEGKRLLDLLNEKMRFYDLCENEDEDSILHIRGMISFKSFVLTMSSGVEADRLCFLHGIQLGNTTVTIERSQDWIGPEPKFKSYLEFLRSRSDVNAKKRSRSRPSRSSQPERGPAQPNSSRSPEKMMDLPNSRWAPQSSQNDKSPQRDMGSIRHSSANKPKRPPTPLPTDTVVLASDSDEEVQIVEEHEELKKLEKDNKHLRTVLNAMKHSNDTKAKNIESLLSQLRELETQLASKAAETSTLQTDEFNLNNQIATTRQNVNDIHDSWQSQALILTDQQKEVDGVRKQLTELSRDAKNVEISLLDERNECQELQTALQRFASHPLSLAIIKNQQRNDTGEAPVAASDDAFDI